MLASLKAELIREVHISTPEPVGTDSPNYQNYFQHNAPEIHNQPSELALESTTLFPPLLTL
jgi:hypothetical protein